MLNRRHLRVKVLQVLYSYQQSEIKEILPFEKALLQSVDKVNEMYFWLLSLLIEVADYSTISAEGRANKHLPSEEDLNEPVTFTLENLDKKDKIFASLLNNEYVPEFHTIVKHFKSKTPIEAVVTEINPHGIYVDLAGEKLKAKIPLGKNAALDTLAKGLQKGDLLKVNITNIGKNRINVIPTPE